MKAIVVDHPTILSILENRLSKENGGYWTTVIICCMTRDEFLEDIAATHSDTDDTHESTAVEKLLNPTINQILASQTIRLVFTPTIPHVRAYLAVASFAPHTRVSILNPISLHYGSSEFSAQGFMQTFALAIEAAARNEVEVIEMCELADVAETDSTPWDIKVPLLSDSAQVNDEDDDFEGRTMSIRKMAERWFEVPEWKREGRGNNIARQDRHSAEEDMDVDEMA